MSRLLDAATMRRAFQLVDAQIPEKARLIVGGGAAMILAYSHPVSTHDVDAFAARGGLSVADIDLAAKDVAKKLTIAGDWLNSHFDAFTIVLPSDYVTRLRRVFSGKLLTVDALGPEDVLIMKCFAGRPKDILHGKTLMKHISDRALIEKHLALLVERRYPNAQAAADRFDDLCDEFV